MPRYFSANACNTSSIQEAYLNRYVTIRVRTRTGGCAQASTHTGWTRFPSLASILSTRRPPATLAQVPLATLRQMAAYAAALAGTYPGRTIEAALLYTQTPVLIEVPEAVLAEHKLALLRAEESLGA